MARVATGLGITRGAVAQWRKVPAERVAEVSALTGIPKHELRPDLWEAPDVVADAEVAPSSAEAA